MTNTTIPYLTKPAVRQANRNAAASRHRSRISFEQNAVRS